MLDTKKILSDNLTLLLARRPGISRLELSRQMQVADGTLGRIKYGTGNPTIEVVDQIARFFKVEPWRLLTPNLGSDLVGFDLAGDGEINVLSTSIAESLRSLPPDDRKDIVQFIKMKIEKADWERGQQTSSKAS
ncbi:helix-turn-helix transcriptional regulator [Burkholderia plantarii]|nr:helix-turn-helix transcriptional regulator [Burkholderia plantarii]